MRHLIEPSIGPAGWRMGATRFFSTGESGWLCAIGCYLMLDSVVLMKYVRVNRQQCEESMKSVKHPDKRRLFSVTVVLIALLLSGCNLFVSTEERIQQAIEYREKGDLNAAAIEFRNVLKKEPDNAQARWLLGKTYLDMGDALSAKKELLKAKDLGIGSDELKLALARAFLQTDEADVALELIDSSPALSSQHKGLVLLGEAQFALERSDEARQSFLAALKADSSSLHARYGLIMLALRDRDYTAASDQIEQVLKQSPKDRRGLIYKAELALVQGRVQQAIEAYHQALGVQDSHMVRLGLARAYLASAKPDEADKEIEKVLKQVPDNLQALYLQAVAATQREDYDSAKTKLQAVLAKAPGHLPSMLLLGAVHFNLGEYEQAVSSLVSYLAEDVANLRAKKLLAQTYVRLGDIDRAIERLESAADSAPNDPQLMGILGKLYSEKGDYETAQKYYEKTLALAPGAKEIETRIALNRWAVGEHDRAIEDLNAIVSQDDEYMPAELALITAKMQAKDYADALVDARKLIKKRPELPLGYVMAASALDALQQRDQARDYLQRAVEADPTYIKTYLILARFDAEAGDSEAARRHLETAVSKKPGDEQALLLLAQQEEKAGNAQRALELVRQAYTANPDSLAPRLLLASVSLQERDLERAKQLVDESLAIAPENPAVLRLAGDTALLSNDRQTALSYYDKLLAVKPEDAAVQMKRGTLLVQAGDVPAGRNAFKAILAQDSSHLMARLALGELDLLEGHADKALVWADGLIRDFKDKPDGYSLKGDVRMREKNLAAAAKLYRKAYKLAPEQRYLLKTVNALNAQKQSKESLPLYEEWLANHPQDSAVRVSYATQLLAGGMRDQALAEYQKIIDKQADNLVVLNNMAWLYQQKGDLEKARELAQKAYEKAPGVAGVIDTYGWILVNSGQLDQGLSLLEEAVAKGNGLADIRYHLAAAHAKAGNNDRARRVLEELLAEQASFADRAEAEKLLQSLP